MTEKKSSTARTILVVAVIAAFAAVGVTALLVNIMEHKQEARNPFFRVVELDDDTEDPAVWGKNFPIQYDTYKRTVDMVRTKFGGSEALPRTPTERDPRSLVTTSKIEEDPRLKRMWLGYAFAVDFREERGHAYMLDDQTFTERQQVVKQPGTCMNCHSFAMNDPGNMVLHLRESYGGTILHRNGVTEKINARAGKMFAAAAFPSWHPSGRYIAFSVNRVNQIFHATGTRRATALDLKSDIVLYDTDKHEMKIPDYLSRSDRFETFPCFSPDGTRLNFCSADSVRMPAGFDTVRYSLCSVPFDAEKGEFGAETDTLVSAAATGRSCSIPRVSPDGNFLMFTVSDYGAFPSYNPESDIRIMDLRNSNCFPADSLNSPDADSWHSWSSNSRWIVLSSRRMDGLYSNLYIAYIDADGIARKPFLLPQKDPGFHDSFLYSFNVPEFAVKPVQVSPYEIERLAKRTPPAPVQAGSSH